MYLITFGASRIIFLSDVYRARIRKRGSINFFFRNCSSYYMRSYGYFFNYINESQFHSLYIGVRVRKEYARLFEYVEYFKYRMCVLYTTWYDGLLCCARNVIMSRRALHDFFAFGFFFQELKLKPLWWVRCVQQHITICLCAYMKINEYNNRGARNSLNELLSNIYNEFFFAFCRISNLSTHTHTIHTLFRITHFWFLYIRAYI